MACGQPCRFPSADSDPVAIAVNLAYLLEPLVPYQGERGYGRTEAIGALFTIAFFALAAVLT